MPVAPVVVVGAGPVGLTAALLLARRGLEVVVLERHRAPYPQPRAVHLDDEVLRVLQDAGVADEVAKISRPLAGLRLLDEKLRVLAEFERREAGANGWPQDVLFHQPDLEDVLRGALAEAPRITLHMGAEVTGLRQDADGVDVSVRDRDTEADRSVRAAAVLGCDGANSTVRRLIGATMRDLGPADRWLVVDVRSPSPLPIWPGTHQVCGPRPATFMPVTGDRYRWEFRLAPGESAADLGSPERVADLLAPYGVGAVELERIAEYTFRAQVADRWRAGRVLLAGDAAHLTPPFVGQGLGLGLRDVHQLAWKIADVVTGQTDDAVLDTYQAEREPHARALIRIALTVGRLMTGGGAAAAAVRPAVLAVVTRIPLMAAHAADTSTPALRRGRLVERRGRAGRRLAGTLVPQPDVIVDGRPARLDDVLGGGSAQLRLLRAGRLLVRRADGSATELDDPELVLTRWLRRGRAREVTLRPDRIVRSAS